MPGSNQSETSHSSGFVGSSATTDQKQNYNTPAIQVGNAVRDGDEFVLLVRSRQSEGFKIWSSSDPETTEQLYKQAAPAIAMREDAST